MRNEIYYFSATGNSLKIARVLAAALGDAAITPMQKYRGQEAVATQAACVGLVFPVYFAGLPLLVGDFIRRLRTPRDCYIFAVASCGYTFGTTLLQADRLLRENGRELRAGFVLKMPDNYIISMSPGSKAAQAKRFASAEKRLRGIAATVRAGKRVPLAKDFFLINWLLSGLNYPRAAARFCEQDRSFWVTEACDGCGTCARVCPVGNIAILEKKPVWQHRCEQCLACLQWCPREALQSGKGTPGRRRYRHPEARLKDFIQG